ncbi:MAG: class I SAM-dependent methyltransferase [Bacteroidales bacterium]
MNLYLIRNTLLYYLSSRHKFGHAIHSPFVYSFIRDVLRDKTQYPEYAIIEKERKNIKKSHLRITVQDFGAGSQVIHTHERKVKDIARTSLSPQKYAQLLFRLTRYIHAQNILEIGSSLGISGAYIAKAVPQAQFISLEGAEQIAAIARNTFTACGCTNATIRIGSFADTLSPAIKKLGTIDIAFIDGNHQEEATLDYFEKLYPYCHSKTILVFDDIYWSKGMNTAWKKICTDKRVSISVDLCKMGLIFFRTGIAKQHFTIRF